MSAVTELMLYMDDRYKMLFYHRDTNVFDGYPVSEIQLKTLDENARIPEKDENNFRFLSYEEIDHESIMRFYVKECVEDKEDRKRLFNVLRRRDYVKPFVEALRDMGLYEDFDMVCGDVYRQMFEEWAERNGLDFSYSGGEKGCQTE